MSRKYVARFNMMMVGLEELAKNCKAMADGCIKAKDENNMNQLECFDYGRKLAYQDAEKRIRQLITAIENIDKGE